MKFYEQQGALYVKDGNEKEILVTAHFMQSENQAKAEEYLDSVSEKLNAMEPFSDEMAEYLQAVEDKVREQMTAEKCMEDVAF